MTSASKSRAESPSTVVSTATGPWPFFPVTGWSSRPATVTATSSSRSRYSGYSSSMSSNSLAASRRTFRPAKVMAPTLRRWLAVPGRGGPAAVARRLDRHVRVRGGDLELLINEAGLFPLAQPDQAFVVAVQAPDVSGVLARPGQRVVQAEVGPVDGFGLGHPSLLQEERAVGVPGRLHPAPRLIVGKPVVELDRVPQPGEGLVVVPPAVLQFPVQHRPGHGEDVPAGVVEDGARLRDPPG